jgi:hypothetical protein
MTDDAWAPLREGLDRWARAGRRPTFWLRDDDAIAPTPALDRLLTLTGRFEIPLVLASIPAYATPALADRLVPEPLVRVAVHGWSHANHAPEGEKKQELGLHRSENEVLDDLRRGLDRIGELYGGQAVPLLVPPWNRIEAALLPALPSLGFEALSVYGPTKPAPLPLINSTVDIMDWHGTRGCLPTPVLVETIAAQLQTASTGDEAIGLLTHHLVHDAAAWTFLEQLFELTRAKAHWLGFDALMARASRPAS